MAADQDTADEIYVTVPEDTRSWYSVSAPVAPTTLGESLRKFVAGLETAFNEVPATVASYDLNQFEVSVVVSAEGGVSLLGTGGKAGVQGGLKLTFSRPKAEPAKR